MKCLGCQRTIENARRGTKKYCSKKCKKSAENARHYIRRKMRSGDTVYGGCGKCNTEDELYPYYYKTDKFIWMCMECHNKILLVDIY